MKKQDSQLRGRRDFIKQAGFLGAGLLAGTSSLPAVAQTTASSASSACNHDHQQTPFFGTHQAGITTPAQKHIYFMVLDLHSQDINEIKEMFQTWTKYSQKLTKGEMVEGYSENGYIPPKDTGEAEDLPTYNLTLTFGVSPSFFKKLNIEKFCPPELVDLPHFPRDQLREEYSGGDICIQACADDPQVAFHAVRNLVRVARSHITMHWSQSGFNSFDKHTPRNLFGFRDGTANHQQGEALDKVVWYQGNNWLKEGSFLIARRVQMFLETWDRTNLNEQQNTFGRYKQNGAAYGQKEEFDKVKETMENKMEDIVDELVKIHNENFKNKVEDKYFSEMMLSEQYEIYCLFNYTKENIFVEKLKKEDKNKILEKNQKEKTDLDKNEKFEKNVLGYVAFYGTIESIDIFEIAIKKEYQGQCFGEKLLTESMRNLLKNNKNSKIKNIHFSENKFLLEVNENNIKALKLYKKIGFEQISVRKNYYGNNENAIIMMKII